MYRKTFTLTGIICSKSVFLLFILFFCCFSHTQAQTLSTPNFTGGTFTPGSSIGVPFHIDNTGGCIQSTNQYNLYLSDALGNFSPGTIIGTISGAYATYVNGVIPTNMPAGTGYKVMVKATAPAIASSPSVPFTITAGTAITAAINGQIVNTDPHTFGACNGQPNTVYSFVDNSTTNSSVATFFNESSQSSAGTVTLNQGGNFTAAATNYTILATATNGTTIGTQAYSLINNVVNNSFEVSNTTTVCLVGAGGTLSYFVDTSSPNGIQNNYPGVTYHVSWGDGSTSDFSYCDIIALSNQVTHTYTTGSCGHVANGIANAFEVDIQPETPYCTSTTPPLTSYARILKVPTNSFTFPAVGCTNAPITFTNTSDPGQDPNATVNSCANPNALYTWSVDGSPVLVGVPITTQLVHTFTTDVVHTITLHLITNGSNTVCGTGDVTQTICIQNPPQPAFTIPATICLSSPLTPTDQSVVDPGCGGVNPYLWTVTGPAAVTYAGGTSASSTQPQFVFTKSGVYTIKLTISNSGCSATSLPQTINVDAPPTVSMSPDIALCGTNVNYTFGPGAGPTKTVISGTATAGPGTYLWIITGNTNYTFIGGTSASSQYPQIEFTAYGTYNISVTVQNSCGTVTKSQNIVFQNAPTVTVTPSTTDICPGSSVTLTGVITPQAGTTFQWVGAGVFSAPSSLITDYTPSAAEIAAHSATIQLVVQTGLTGTCSQITQNVTINIFPVNTITGPPAETICTGGSVNYSPAAVISGSTFSWTASVTSGTATGYTASGTGATINDIITNTSTTTNAVVTYVITPQANGCTGTSFNLVVTIKPDPIITATPANTTICSGSAGLINLLSNLTGTSYTWTSVVLSGGLSGNNDQTVATTNNSIADVLTNTGITVATIQYTVTPFNGTCPGTPVTATINVEPLPTVANAGANAELCSATTYTLSGNAPDAGTGKWTVAPVGTVTFSDATQPNAIASGLVPGNTYVFTWTITVLNCQSNSNSITIKDDMAPVGGTTNGSTAVCSGSNNGTINLTGQQGTIVRWEQSIDNGTTWQVIANTNTSQSYLNLTTTTQYRVLIENGICSPVYSTVATITVNPPATQANAGPNDEVCNTTTYTLQGNAPTSGVGKWTVTSGPPGAIFADDTQANTTVSGLIPGSTYDFNWAITPAAPCVANSSSVTVKIDAPPVGGTTGTSAAVCSGSNSGTITLTGQFGIILRWEQSTDNGVTWQPIVNTTTTQQYLNLSTTTQYRAVVQNGVCPAVNSTVTIITVNPPAIQSNAGANDEVCNAIVYMLQGNSPGTAAGKWTLTSAQTGVTFADDTQPNTTVSGLTPGSTYDFTWTITPLAPCAPNSSSVSIKDDAAPVGGTVAGTAAVCSDGNSGTLTLGGQLGNVIRWESSIDNGTTWQPIANTTSTQQYLNLTTTTQYRAVVQNGVCPPVNSAPAIITVNPPAVQSNAGANAEICNSTTYVLQGNSPGTAAGKWTLTSGQTGITFADNTQPNTTASGLIPGNTYDFKWTITPLAPCAPNSSSVSIKDDAAPVGGTTAGTVSVCSGLNSGTITLSGQLGNVIRWELSTDNGATWQPVTNTTSTLQYLNLSITTQYRAVVQNGVCASVNSAPTTITVNPPAVQADAGANAEICNSPTYVLQGNSPGTAAGKWTLTSGQAGISFVDDTQPNTTVSGLLPDNTYNFTWTITPLAPCAPTASSVTVKNDPATVGGTTTANATVCSGDNSGTITLTGQVGNILRWESSVDNGASWQLIANTSPAEQYLNLTTTTQYRAVVQSAVCNLQYSTVTTITVNPVTLQANAGNNQNLCGVTSTTLLANNPSPFLGSWVQTTGPAATIANPNNFQTQVTGLITGSSYTFVWTIHGLAPCADSSSPVQIFTAPDVTPSFTADKTNGCGSYLVNFTNTSTSLTGTTFLWNFGDGSAPSNAISPSHTFLPRTDGKDTTYKVSLSIVNNCFQRPPYIVNITVSPSAPIASILPAKLNGCSPFSLTVKNTSPGTGISYVFYLYDGNTLLQQINKTDKSDAVFDAVSETTTKVLTVYMVETGSCNNTAETTHVPITVSPSSVTAQMFIENNLNKGCVPLTVTFVNNTEGGDDFYYTIYSADSHVLGQFTAGKDNFPYTFATVGTYYVSLTGSDNCSTNESPKTRIDVYPVPAPLFDADVKTGCDRVVVNFTNLTASSPTAPASSLTYIWDFGDNTKFTGFTPPSHVYDLRQATYNVTLTATNGATGCSEVLVKQSFITVTSPPGAQFAVKPDSVINIPDYHFAFVDQTTGKPLSYTWDFGDGTTSTSQNPEHTYPDTGIFKVTLTVTGALGCDSTVVHHVRITGTPGQLFLPNAFEPDGLSTELRTFAAKGSGIKTWHMQIFNNYAELVWETTALGEKGEPVNGWDGTFKGIKAPQGVYVWQVSATFINGTEWSGNVIKNSLPKRVGVVHLIR